jgi:hypothetical protein
MLSNSQLIRSIEMLMIPGFIDEVSSPPGEVTLYRKLHQANVGWTVIHSLDLAPFNRMKRTEIDFLIIIPDIGLLCVEVKSHKEIGFDGQNWYPESVKKSPFQQAMDARYALQRRLSSELALWKDVPVIHCCIFPNANFSVPRNLSIQPFEIMDKRRFRSLNLPDEFCSTLRGMAEKLINSDPQIKPLKKSLSEMQIRQFIEFCYPVRKRCPENAEEIRERGKELESKLRIQQAPVLKLTDWNSRILMDGGAGTGKTLIGLEIARRKARQGKRTGFLTFNRLVGQWAQAQLALTKNPLLIAGPVNSILVNMFDIKVPKDPCTTFWADILLKIQDDLTRPGPQHEAMFDCLVIDEAQDFLGRPDLLETIELLLKGGFENGEYLLMGDFRNQVLTYDREVIDTKLNQLRRYSTCWKLDENCRNYTAIGNLAITLSDANKQTYSGYMRSGGGLKSFELAIYSDINDEIGRIEKFVSHILKEGFRAQDITFLSYGSISKSCFEQMSDKSNLKLQSASENKRPNYIEYSTAHAFKGLENKVIVLTDVELDSIHANRNRFYTAITRATEQVLVLCSERSKPDLLKWINQQD